MTQLTLFKASFQDSGIPQVITDLGGSIVEANEAFCRLLRYDDLCGVHYSKIRVRPQKEEVSPDSMLRGRKNYLAQEQYTKRNGTRVWAQVYHSAVYENERVKYVLGQVIDMSTQHALEADLQTKQDEIERFTYIASHDLREPLSSIAGYATLIQRRCKDSLSDQGQHWLDEVIGGTKKMAQKVDGLLALSRAGGGKPQGTFPLGAAVQEAKRALSKQFRDTEGRIVIVGELPEVRGDRALIANVFQNLFSNSLKYRSETTPTISIEASPHEGMWKVSVSDNGLGFDADQFGERIFEVFQRLYTVEEHPGTGIGLALAKKIVDRHGGTIWTESSPGNGATFHFTLPPKA